jgi:MFS family permease
MTFPLLRKINPVVMIMIYSDFLITLGAGFLSPIFAVFLTEQIKGGSLAVAGFSTMLFWVAKSFVQVPVSLTADRIRGERDDFLFIASGSLVVATVPLLYYFFATQVWHVYLLQILDGIGYGLLTPPWLAVFTRHIDKHRESVEWTIHSNIIGLAFAVAAAVGGVLAEQFGFRLIFLMVSVALFIGAFLLMGIRKYLYASKDGGNLKEEIMLQRQQESIVRQ